MIQSFADSETQAVFEGIVSRRLPSNLQSVMHRKLLLVDAAMNINDLRVPPGNRLEALSGDRKGQHSIRVNQQWRICFVWTITGPADVEIVDYH
ncbi:MAG TPA: type II toxin-antitoxin system RelE/ParE family toxin [Chthoniobacter sp.]|jgi:proteic killer suppression protein